MPLDDDEVVTSIPVYMSQTTTPMYLLQYPLRAASRGEYDLLGGRLQPLHKNLEVDFETDCAPAPYSRLPGKRRRTMHSTVVQPETNYAVGKMHDGALYLAPIATMAQMRPSFAHVDNIGVDPDEAAKPKAAVAVALKRKQTMREAAAKLNSYAHKRSEMEAEPWVAFGVDSKYAASSISERAAFGGAGGEADAPRSHRMAL
mmetsp:Transcript_17256/g.59906  ORF Transcript_17256/g.59906 Transcript_17256/m.59906 type:complete len:202 (-) Transcript_17256:3970-4575(-)